MKRESLQLLGLARKAGKLEIGEEPVGAVTRAKRGRLVLVASDAGDHTFRRVKSFTAGTKQPWIRLDCTKDEFGDAIGYSAVAIAAITDIRLALAFAKTLEPAEKYAELLSDLEVRAARTEQRQKEEKAHKLNVKKHKTKKI